MSQKPGRTPKVSTQEKIALVDRYFITTTDGNTALLKKHGVYRNLSDYAKSLDYPLEPYDFSRDNHVRDHIDQLIANSAQEPHILSGMPTYEPLDVTALMMNGREHIENTLRNREAYFVALHYRAAKAIESYVSVSQLCTQYQSEIAILNGKNTELHAQNDVLIAELRDAQKDIAYLKRIIRKNVEPEQAQLFLDGLTSREVIVERAALSVSSSIYELTLEDQQIQADAQAEIEGLNLSHLFK